MRSIRHAVNRTLPPPPTSTMDRAPNQREKETSADKRRHRRRIDGAPGRPSKQTVRLASLTRPSFLTSVPSKNPRRRKEEKHRVGIQHHHRSNIGSNTLTLPSNTGKPPTSKSNSHKKQRARNLPTTRRVLRERTTTGYAVQVSGVRPHGRADREYNEVR